VSSSPLFTAADWFRREAQSSIVSTVAAEREYGPSAVSDEAKRRSKILFAAASVIDRLQRSSDLTGARLAADEFREAFT
jgi:hypothetical protein